jgi:hypothetical protein
MAPEIAHREQHLAQFTGLPEQIWQAHRRVAAALKTERGNASRVDVNATAGFRHFRADAFLFPGPSLAPHVPNPAATAARSSTVSLSCMPCGGSRIAVEPNGRYFWHVTASTSA